MPKDLEILIDREACRGAGECVFRAPRSFQLDEGGRAALLPLGRDDEATVLAAARACPHFAIRVRRGTRWLVR